MQVQDSVSQDILQALITLCQVNQSLAVHWAFELDDILSWNEDTLERMQDDILMSMT